MAKKTGPYIGVTGFMSSDEVKQALAVIPEGSSHRLMIGVLMSSKTLAGQTNKWPGRYPKREDVADIFVEDERALNLIHYNTDTPNNICAELRQIVDLAGPNLDGFQLNLKWPSPSQIEMFAEAHPEMFLLLQIGGGAMAEVSSMEKFYNAVGWYQPFIDAILIDPSGGVGKHLDPEKGAEYLRNIPPGLGLGIAGGLSENTLFLLDSLVQEFPNLSIDAEGRLRTPQPEDRLDLGAMRSYISEAYKMFSGGHSQQCSQCGAQNGRHIGGCSLAPRAYKTPEGIAVVRTPREYLGEADEDGVPGLC